MPFGVSFILALLHGIWCKTDPSVSPTEFCPTLQTTQCAKDCDPRKHMCGCDRCKCDGRLMCEGWRAMPVDLRAQD